MSATGETSERADGRRRAPVMRDVAKLAGVSHQTVSRVLNGSPQVRAATRERVLAAMRELDYRPNSAARTLVTGRSRTLGVVSFDTTLFGPASTLYAIERAAHEAGYFITIVSLEALDRASVLSAVDRLRMLGVDGILVIAPLEGAGEALLALPRDLPLVAVEAGPADALPVVAVDQLAGAALATRHLLELGHPTVAHIGGPADFLEAVQRVDGWRATLQAAGAVEAPVLLGDWSPRSGYELARRLLEDGGSSAIFVANDQMALGVLRALHEAGRDVPSQVSVVGFDDIPEAQYYNPPLTTVRQDFGEIGRRSLSLMLAMMDAASEDEGPPSPPLVMPELILRSSTAPA
jgi:DNA-binding LacI/PurR family transcriptional regulator